MIRAFTAGALLVAALLGSSQEVVRNPRQLRAVQLLAQRPPGIAPRVRFEWDQVPGAREYLLGGQWANPPSWTMQSREYRVTPQTATRWDAKQVQFDVSLPEGSHSWKVVALFGRDDRGDFANPTPFSFDVR